jgi:hypothetical protein
MVAHDTVRGIAVRSYGVECGYYRTLIGRSASMPSKWRALWTNVTLCWWLYVWAVDVFMGVAWFRHDARFWGVDFTGFFIVNAIGALIYVVVADVVPPFWWLVTLPWQLRSRPLAAVGIVVTIALWLALLLAVIPRYYGPTAQLVSASVSVIVIVALYRFARYRRRKRGHLAESALN